MYKNADSVCTVIYDEECSNKNSVFGKKCANARPTVLFYAIGEQGGVLRGCYPL